MSAASDGVSTGSGSDRIRKSRWPCGGPLDAVASCTPREMLARELRTAPGTDTAGLILDRSLLKEEDRAANGEYAGFIN